MNFIADYSGESDTSETETPENKRKDLEESNDDEFVSKKQKLQTRSLPPPVGIQSMFGGKEVDSEDDTTDHEGRIRTFAHERGNWASYVYIPVEAICRSLLQDITQSLLSDLTPLADFRVMDHFHISLSRTFIVRHHWISPLVKQLQTEMAACKRSLPPPVGIQSMFGGEEVDTEDDVTDHEGRIRTFAHERGNWASYVYIPVEAICRSLLQDITQSLLSDLTPLADFRVMDHFHISLSRTFVVRHHWISPLVKQLQTEMAACKRTRLHFTKLKIYTNDEKTRTFISLCVGGGVDMLQTYTHKIDGTLQQYKLPKYYEDPSFHISLAWAVGDLMDQLTSEKGDQIKQILEDHSEEDLDVFGDMSVDQLQFKAGNKVFSLPLHSS